jgi:hypothetical protein
MLVCSYNSPNDNIYARERERGGPETDMQGRERGALETKGEKET